MVKWYLYCISYFYCMIACQVNYACDNSSWNINEVIACMYSGSPKQNKTKTIYIYIYIYRERERERERNDCLGKN
jgi:hypothetical protein